jgi:hypothetical protein
MRSVRPRTAARHRALALMAMLMFVWCQMMAAAHAYGMAAADGRSAVDMADMAGCEGLPDKDSDGASDCPTQDSTSDGGKIPLFFPLPPSATRGVVRACDHGLPALARHQLPQGRAPPRSRLCSWLI